MHNICICQSELGKKSQRMEIDSIVVSDGVNEQSQLRLAGTDRKDSIIINHYKCRGIMWLPLMCCGFVSVKYHDTNTVTDMRRVRFAGYYEVCVIISIPVCQNSECHVSAVISCICGLMMSSFLPKPQNQLRKISSFHWTVHINWPVSCSPGFCHFK